MGEERVGELPVGIRHHILGFLAPTSPPEPASAKQLKSPLKPSAATHPAATSASQDQQHSSNHSLLPHEKEAVSCATSAAGFIIRDGFLGREKALELAVNTRDLCVTGEVELRAAKMSHGAAARRDESSRGDRTCWLTNYWRENSGPFAHLFSTIRRYFSEDDPDLCYDPRLTSVQLGMYPGNGARYVEHRDTGVVSAADGVKGQAVRKLTLVYYLNPFWTESDGGELVIGGRKVLPKLDRLVVFKSTMLHQVLPCFAPRWVGSDTVLCWAVLEISKCYIGDYCVVLCDAAG